MSDFSAAAPALARALLARGYTEPTQVQEAVLQSEADGRDLLVSAQTGSGKTVAYGMAFASNLLGGEDTLPRAGAPMALIIAPTRELAMQVGSELEWLYGETGVRIASCIGGTDGRAEGRALMAGAHIVVGTPGRLCDHLRRGRLNLGELRVVVLDEADEMLDLGFRDELEQILQACPAERRTLLFSATIARPIAALAKTYQRDALRIDTLVRNQPHADIDYRAIRVAPHEVERAVVNVLRLVDSPNALVFCATRDAVRQLQGSLTGRGFASVALSGELTQNERTRAVQAIRSGSARVCVATDVAARGLDLPELGLVIHTDLPTNRATLLHRSGRTGRAGHKGISAVIVPANRARAAATLFSSAGINPTWTGAPQAAEIRAQDARRLREDPALAEPASPEDLELAHALLEGRPAEEVVAALVRLHRAQLPVVQEISDVSRPIPHTPSSPRSYRERTPDEAGETPRERPVRRERTERGEMVWFSLPVGRNEKADPKWLLPLICRLGGVDRGDVGSIRILDRETRFEITQDAATDFVANLPAEGEEEVNATRSEAPPASSFRPRTFEDRRTDDHSPARRFAPRAGKPVPGKAARPFHKSARRK